MIGVRNEYSFTETKNAADAAFLIATTGGELVNIVKAAFSGNGSLCGNEQYSDMPNSWVIAVAAISETEGFKSAVAEYFKNVAQAEVAQDAKRILMNEANAEFITISNMLKTDLISAKARYAVAVAKYGNIVTHDHIARDISALEYVAHVVTDLKAQVLAFLATVEKATSEEVAVKLGADEFQTSIKLAALVREKKATQDKRGFFRAV